MKKKKLFIFCLFLATPHNDDSNLMEILVFLPSNPFFPFQSLFFSFSIMSFFHLHHPIYSTNFLFQSHLSLSFTYNIVFYLHHEQQPSSIVDGICCIYVKILHSFSRKKNNKKSISSPSNQSFYEIGK
jgi:hypothetical protein